MSIVTRERLAMMREKYWDYDPDLVETAAAYHTLARDYNILLAALQEAARVIEGLADQQAMPDDFYESPLAYFKALAGSAVPI
jgi:hypothetical protein